MNYFINQKNISLGTTKKLIFIPTYKDNKVFKTIYNNKILFCFDNYMLTYMLYADRAFLIKGNFEHLFKNGFIFTNDTDDNVYFFSFFNNSVNLLYKNKKILSKIIYSALMIAWYLL